MSQQELLKLVIAHRFELLSRLTNQGLKDIGVASLGHRLRILETVSKSTADDRSSEVPEELMANGAGKPIGSSPPAPEHAGGNSALR